MPIFRVCAGSIYLLMDHDVIACLQGVKKKGTHYFFCGKAEKLSRLLFLYSFLYLWRSTVASIIQWRIIHCVNQYLRCRGIFSHSNGQLFPINTVKNKHRKKVSLRRFFYPPPAKYPLMWLYRNSHIGDRYHMHIAYHYCR